MDKVHQAEAAAAAAAGTQTALNTNSVGGATSLASSVPLANPRRESGGGGRGEGGVCTGKGM